MQTSRMLGRGQMTSPIKLRSARTNKNSKETPGEQDRAFPGLGKVGWVTRIILLELDVERLLVAPLLGRNLLLLCTSFLLRRARNDLVEVMVAVVNVVVYLPRVALVEALIVGAVVGGEARVDRLCYFVKGADRETGRVLGRRVGKSHIIVLGTRGVMVSVARMGHGDRRRALAGGATGAGADETFCRGRAGVL